uniref:Ig-like domain-containing protein n=1 Tax=Oryzias melastigma TaxID=30732 RepID=A0A3B3DT67_ORYME
MGRCCSISTSMIYSMRRITGRRGLDITLPCNYDIKTNGPTEVCWGRGDLPFRGCSDQVLATDGHQVKEDTRVSSRYQLKGRLDEGDVSLTIMNITDEDTGLYGCRVQVPGLFNDLKDHVLLTVKAGEEMIKESTGLKMFDSINLKLSEPESGVSVATIKSPDQWSKDSMIHHGNGDKHLSYVLPATEIDKFLQAYATIGEHLLQEKQHSCSGRTERKYLQLFE